MLTEGCHPSARAGWLDIGFVLMCTDFYFQR